MLKRNKDGKIILTTAKFFMLSDLISGVGLWLYIFLILLVMLSMGQTVDSLVSTLVLFVIFLMNYYWYLDRVVDLLQHFFVVDWMAWKTKDYKEEN